VWREGRVSMASVADIRSSIRFAGMAVELLRLSFPVCRPNKS
jgi:hypothetical protein